ncbi:metal ABC transporter permease, partial [Clostridium perfringens]|nr:metal ABC transporter permease [Clostridium perfringens]
LINYIFTIIVGATISVSIRVMGILVISSIIVIPAATAMQFKKGFTKSLIISMIIGVIDVLSGLLLASLFDLAPGGTIALTSVIVLILSLILNRKKL